MASCPICCETFDQKSRVKVSCAYCEHEACRACVQRYLVSIVDDPHCMGCKNAWNREFVDQSCTKSFRNGDLKKHREQLLFEREKCLLPEAQDELIRRREITRLIERQDQIRGEIASLQLQHGSIEGKIWNLRHDKVPHEKKEFVRKCPANECRGFLSTRWKCDVCENYICSECNEIKGDDHQCDPEAVETMKLLKKDTKPCVKCGTMIFKISGCSQMWCPDCHTAFDWNTGRIATGVIHNPHFYDFQRQHGRLARTPGDVPCGGLPDLMDLNALFGARYQRPTSEVGNMFYKIHRLVNHIEFEELRRNPPASTLDLRVMYLQNDISEDRFKQKLQQLEKRREKRRDIVNIYAMFSHTCSDILREVIQDRSKIKELTQILTELRAYTNQTFENIKRRYGGTAPVISNLWELD